MSDSNRPIWEQRLPGESLHAYEAFRIYLSLRRPSLQAVHRHIRKSEEHEHVSSAIRGWAKRFQWHERRKAYVDHWTGRVAEANFAIEYLRGLVGESMLQAVEQFEP